MVIVFPKLSSKYLTTCSGSFPVFVMGMTTWNWSPFNLLNHISFFRCLSRQGWLWIVLDETSVYQLRSYCKQNMALQPVTFDLQKCRHNDSYLPFYFLIMAFQSHFMAKSTDINYILVVDFQLPNVKIALTHDTVCLTHLAVVKSQ